MGRGGMGKGYLCSEVNKSVGVSFCVCACVCACVCVCVYVCVCARELTCPLSASYFRLKTLGYENVKVRSGIGISKFVFKGEIYEINFTIAANSTKC